MTTICGRFRAAMIMGAAASVLVFADWGNGTESKPQRQSKFQQQYVALRKD
jgi:hypothetical protein